MSPVTRKRYSLCEVQELTKLSGNLLLSPTFKGFNEHHALRCSRCDQNWAATLRQIKNGRSCPYCSGHRKTIDSVRKIGTQKGFTLISHEYKSMDAKYEWKCRDGHIFWRSANHTKKTGSKCPQCHFFLTEEKCRFIFESLTGHEFLKTRKVLGGLELDGYCGELSLAFEYNGRQHYDKSSLFADDFHEMQNRDKIKISKCRNLNIKLIVIPYTESDNLIIFITNEIKVFGINCSGNVNWNNFNKYQSNKMEYLTEILFEQDIQCLSKKYLGCDTKIDLKCLKCGKMWKNSPEVLSRGVGCPHCKHKMWTIKQAQEFCSRRQITLLNDDYTTKSKKYSFQCDQCSHIWSTTMFSIINGRGCSKCSKQHVSELISKKVLQSMGARMAQFAGAAGRPKTLRYSVSEIQDFCQANEWTFLENTYQNQNTRYRFQCQKCKHITTTTFKRITQIVARGSNCSKCR